MRYNSAVDFSDVFILKGNNYLQWDQSQRLGTMPTKGPKGKLALSEIMTIVIHFHQTRHRDFKTYYNDFVRVYLQSEFPNLVS